MKRTNIYLAEEQLQALKRLAAERDRSVATLVRDAVDAYLMETAISDDVWREQFDNLLAQIRSRVPEGISSEEIEMDITAARDEVRKSRGASRSN